MPLEKIELSPLDRGQNKATGRILEVLSCFVSDVAGFGVTELSTMLGMTKNMVYRALMTLIEQGYVVRDASGNRYQLGYRILELQNLGAREPDLRALAAPALREMFELTGETVSLMARALDYAVFIDGIETRRSGTYRMEIGGLRPLHEPASGLVMLAFSQPEVLNAYLARTDIMSGPGVGDRSKVASFRKDLEEVRTRGFARMLRPGSLPMLSIAFPIWGSDGTLHGALSTGGPEVRFGPFLEELLPRMQQIVDDLCRRTRLYPADGRDWILT